MRHSPTPSEARLWEALRGAQLGVSFRRQVVIGPFVVDSLAPDRKLIIEVDGGYHARRSVPDARPERDLSRLGYRLLHVKAEEAHQNLPAAVARILAALGG